MKNPISRVKAFMQQRPSDLVFMEEDDGEVLTLEPSSNHSLIIIEWNDFKLKKNYIKSYKFNFDDIQVNVA